MLWCCYVDQNENGRVISPGYADDVSGALSQREDQPSAHMISDNVQVNVLTSNLQFT